MPASGVAAGSSLASPSSPSCSSRIGHRARRIVTTTTSGIRIPSCGLMRAAMTAKIADRSGRSRHRSRSPSRRKTTPTESTWPQTTESNQLIGLTTATNAAPSARLRRAPSSSSIDQTSQPMTRSARIAGILISPTPTPPMTWPTMPISHRTYRYPGV